MRAGALAGIVFASIAYADRGAVSIDAGGGLTGLQVAAPFASSNQTVNGLSGVAWLGGRYAIRNELELGVSAFYEPPVRYFHEDVSLVTDRGSFPGTLTHQIQRFGGMVGARYLVGMVWRLTLGIDVGWSRRVYKGFQHIDVSGSEPVDYELGLPDFNTDNVLVAPIIGLEWAAGDHWSIAILPRAEFLLGPDATVGVTVPLVLSWSWYL